MSATAATVSTLIPRIGAKWPTAGGVYGGRTSRGHLIVGLRAIEPACWTDAMAWATTRTHLGFHDWSLPSVEDLLVLHEVLQPEEHARFWTHEIAGEHDALVVMFTPHIVCHFGREQLNLAIAVRHHQLN